jgi:hypothetical protein
MYTYNHIVGVAKQRSKLLSAALALALAVVLSLSIGMRSYAYAFPSTNEQNKLNDKPYVELVESGIGEATLNFVNNTNSLAFFEYRIDGEVLSSGTNHPVVVGDYIYSGVCVDNRIESKRVASCDRTPSVRSFSANSMVEIRLALGGERDWDFNWTSFSVIPDAQSKADCKNNGWSNFGFRNQGLCLQFVNTGKDSR